MAPPGSSQTLLSPAELSFLHSSLSLNPPIRPDLRTPTQFRPLIAETDILPSTNGSARICFSDGTETIVGIKAEVEKSHRTWQASNPVAGKDTDMANDGDETAGAENKAGQRSEAQGKGSDAWLEVSIEIPGFRDDDNLPVFLSAMITETLLASGTLREKLWINERFHWKLYIDVLLLSPPLSYPLPLLSLTTHLALLNTALPRLTSEPSDDPLFDDDWAAAVPLYPRSNSPKNHTPVVIERPPVTLLVMTVGENIIFDPSKEELAVAESVMAVSVAPAATTSADTTGSPYLKLLAVRTIDPPSRLTPSGIPNSLNPATNVGAPLSSGLTSTSVVVTPQHSTQEVLAEMEKANVWSPPRGGMKRGLLSKIMKMVVERGGVGEEVLEGLAGVES